MDRLPGGEAGAELVVVLDGAWNVKIEVASVGVSSIDDEALFPDFPDVGDVFSAERNPLL